MQDGRTTLSKFLIDTLDRKPGPEAASGLSALLIDVAASIKTIAAALTRGALGGQHGTAHSINTHGEEQKKLDLVTNDIFLQHCEWDGLLAGMVSEEMDEVYAIPEAYPRGEYLLLFDPLDGRVELVVDALAQRDLDQPVDDLLVVMAEQHIGAIDERHVASELVENACELVGDIAAADDHDPLRQLG